MKEVFPLLTACGGLVVYLDNKLSSSDKNFNDKFHLLDKAFTDSRIQSARTEEECKAYVGQVKIYSEQVIRAEAKSDLKEEEFSREIEVLKTEKRKERAWWL
jgi:hypothetical protein